jgi:hypothetical protein
LVESINVAHREVVVSANTLSAHGFGQIEMLPLNKSAGSRTACAMRVHLDDSLQTVAEIGTVTINRENDVPRVAELAISDMAKSNQSPEVPQVEGREALYRWSTTIGLSDRSPILIIEGASGLDTKATIDILGAMPETDRPSTSQL